MHENNRHIDLMDLSVDEQEGFEKTLKKPKEKTTSPEPERLKKRVRVKELIDGTFLVRENMIRQLPFVLFLTFLGVIYIGNRFHAERMVRQINDLKIEVGNLRSEQITITSELMNISRPSQVAVLVESKGLGLQESLEPPKKLRK
ncbi:MAG: hypothetical protein JW830_14975 [Bacteroidales bacterium]|nr:hypothetical protein [Bacteroidales bacterium]